MKATQTLNKIIKVVRIFMLIGMWCAIVGGVLCAIAAIGVNVIDFTRLNFALNGTDINVVIMDNAGMSLKAIPLALSAAMVICAGAAFVTKSCADVCKYELDAGTPFTYELAKKLERLAIIALVVPFAADITAEIIINVGLKMLNLKDTININASVSIGLALACWIYSLMIKSALETKESENEMNG